jgi:hypothetical protein
MENKMKRTNIFITQKQHLEVSEEAKSRGITFSEMFRKIVDGYLENKNEKVSKLRKRING